jgi:hypothetical protein
MSEWDVKHVKSRAQLLSVGKSAITVWLRLRFRFDDVNVNVDGMLILRHCSDALYAS